LATEKITGQLRTLTSVTPIRLEPDVQPDQLPSDEIDKVIGEHIHEIDSYNPIVAVDST
jgi:hypothetical protein